jgi:acyl-CoA thioesterase I
LIVCFGDSLTAGYQSPTQDWPQLRETPYGAFLQERLGASATVATSGLCGELTGEMAARFSREVIALKPAGVVILGGTNDLGCMVPPEEIMHNLASLYDMALAAETQPVAVTVPSIRIAGDIGAGDDRAWQDGPIRRRRELNGMIQRVCLKKQLSCIDFFTATQEQGSGLLAEPYSNDGLHLTTDGYRLLAELLFAEVFSRDDWRRGAAR